MSEAEGFNSKENYVATINFQTDSQKWAETGTEERLKITSDIVEYINEKNMDNTVILFPAGWINTGDESANTIYEHISEKIMDVLKPLDNNMAICIGIDGELDEDQIGRDQMAITIDRDGIMAIGRKFHPTKTEKERLNKSENYCSPEVYKQANIPRTFKLNGINYYLAVCYDSYGIRQEHLEKLDPKVNVVLNLIHCFYPCKEGPCGEVFFAKHGLAGSSKQWDCTTFASAVFYNNKRPGNWPNGVYWTDDDKSTRFWKYEDNPIKPIDGKVFEIKFKEGIAQVKIFQSSYTSKIDAEKDDLATSADRFVWKPGDIEIISMPKIDNKN